MASKGAQLKRISDIGVIGSPAVTCALFTLVTDDSEATIETAGYLNDDATRFPEGNSSILDVLAVRSGTPVGLRYIVNRTGGVITLTAFKGTA